MGKGVLRSTFFQLSSLRFRHCLLECNLKEDTYERRHQTNTINTRQKRI